MNLKLIIVIFFCTFTGFSQQRDLDSITIEEIKIDSASIRSIQVLKDSSMIFASSNGIIGSVNLNDNEIKIKKIVYDINNSSFQIYCK